MHKRQSLVFVRLRRQQYRTGRNLIVGPKTKELHLLQGVSAKSHLNSFTSRHANLKAQNGHRSSGRIGFDRATGPQAKPEDSWMKRTIDQEIGAYLTDRAHRL